MDTSFKQGLGHGGRGFERHIAANGVEWLAASGWDQIPWLWHGFSTRRAGLSRAYCAEDAPGELNLGFTADDNREAVVANRRLLAEAVSGRAETQLITVSQIHSDVVLRVTDPNGSGASGCQGDGLVTNQPEILLGVMTADCIPVLVADRQKHVVGAFHAGWRGTVKGIVEIGVGRMRDEFGSRAEDLLAAIGPGIGACCFAVGEEVTTRFAERYSYGQELFERRNDGVFLDLPEANRRQLLAAGVKSEAISVVGGCTQCHQDQFFSHRGSKGRAGRMLAVIGMREPGQ